MRAKPASAQNRASRKSRSASWLGCNGERSREYGAICEAAVDWKVRVAWVVPLAPRLNVESVQEIRSVICMPHVGVPRKPEPARPY